VPTAKPRPRTGDRGRLWDLPHSDSVFFPLVPGHEIAGRIEDLGEGTHDSGRQVGDRLVRRLRPRGELMVIGVDPTPPGISPNQLPMAGKILRGHPGGTAQDTQDTMAFSALHGIRPMTEIVPLDQTDEACRKMLSGAPRASGWCSPPANAARAA
jgi:D-arabinose 1-dehydrogenase-like Zn-dependent alcohol dehydrogenase